MENDPRTYAIIGQAMEVHNHLGCGFLDAVYQEALELELIACGLPCRPQVELPLSYKGRGLKTYYRADFICFDEVKALTQLGPIEEAQVINYLKATGVEIGLILNFGRPSLQYKRYILDQVDF